MNGELKFEILDDYYACRIKKSQAELPIKIIETEADKLGAALINLDGTAYKIYESEMLVYKKESTLTPYHFQKKPNRYLERAEF